MLASGTLIYNEILILPFLGFDKNTKLAIALRNQQNKTDENYIGLSPHAAYDSKRNERGLHNELNAT